MGPWAMLAMAMVNDFEKNKQETEAKRLNAVAQLNAPYTHTHPGLYDPKGAPSLTADLAQGGLAGWQLQQNMDSAEQQKQLNEALTGYYNRQGGGGKAAAQKHGAGATDPANPWANMSPTSMYGTSAEDAANGYGTEGVDIDPSANAGAWDGSTMDELANTAYA